STSNALYISDGSGSGFYEESFGDQMGESFAITLADIDNDGDLDVIVANAGTGQQSKVWLNDGAGNLTSSINVGPMDASFVFIVAADFNADGWVDLALAD